MVHPESLSSKTLLIAAGTTLSAAVIVGIASKQVFKRISKKDNMQDEQETRKLNDLRKKKQDEREISFVIWRNEYPKTNEFQDILALSLSQLQEKLFKRQLTAEKVLRAYITKALDVQEEFNCITEFIPGCMEKAKELDGMHMAKGPLHGIPFGVKDDTAVKGMDSTLGCTVNLYKPVKESAGLVQSLESLGAVPFCITNLPQTCVSFGSGNPIFGVTVNPHNKKLAPGGSSSGSGCLVAAGGAPFATGSDTGGSLRNPAHFCGISTIKQTSNRISKRGCQKCVQNLPGNPGVFCKRAKGVARIFQALTENNLQNKIDGKVAPIPWNSQTFESKERVRIGFLESIGPLTPIGDTSQVLLKAKAYLESAGHIFVPFTLPFDISKLEELPWDPDIHGRIDSLLRHDQVYHGISGLYQKDSKTPSPVPSEYTDFLTLKERLIDSLLEEMKSQNVDLLLCPVFPFPALSVDDAALLLEGVFYTMTWNVLDFPAGVVRVWTESGKLWTSSINSHPSMSPELKAAALKVEGEVKGMPIGVQLVGRPFQEELVLRTMVELDEINDP